VRLLHKFVSDSVRRSVLIATPVPEKSAAAVSTQ